MAIKRIPRNLKKFTYEGVEYAVRPPTVEEQKAIINLMAAFQRSVKKEIKSDVDDKIVENSVQTGDATLMTETQQYIARHLVVDPDSRENVFNDDKNDTEHEHIDDVPADFILAAWYCYSNQNDRPPILTVELQALVEQGLLDGDWLKKVSTVPAKDVDLMLASLEAANEFDKVHKLRVALDLKKSEVEGSKTDPPATATVPTTATAATTT